MEVTKQYDFILSNGTTVTHELTDTQRDCFYIRVDGVYDCKHCSSCKFTNEGAMDGNATCIPRRGYNTINQVISIVETEGYEDEVEL